MRRACGTETLASSGAGRVDLCSCGQLHVHLGNITLRLDGDELRAFEELLRTSRNVLDGQKRPNLRLVSDVKNSAQSH